MALCCHFLHLSTAYPVTAAGKAGFLSALLINRMTRARPSIGADAAIGVVTTASFALGLALISRYRTFTRSFDAALFGNILGVTETDLFAIAGVTLAAFVLIFLLYRRLMFTTFDPDIAPFFGVQTGGVDALFSLILAGAIVVSMQVMGVTLIAAAIVIPPVTARLLTDDFGRFTILSVSIGAVCGLLFVEQNILVKDCAGKSMKDADRFVRIASRTPAENQRLVEAFRRLD